MKDFLEFRTMFTPITIEVAWAALSGVLIAGGLFVALDLQGNHPGGERWTGLAAAIFGPLVLCVYAESVVILFKIQDRLRDLLEVTEDSIEALAKDSGAKHA